MTNRIAITPGEPAGIGPDLCALISQRPPEDTELVVVADKLVLEERARSLGINLSLKPFVAGQNPMRSANGELSFIQVNKKVDVTPGVLDRLNSSYVLDSLRTAADKVLSGELDAMVTGPIHKGIINEAGFQFTGHTEYLAKHCERKLTVMMLATEGLRVALATTHLPLSEVPQAISKDLLRDVIKILHVDLITKFGIDSPKILVCGLNPHAGEKGYLGDEEIKVIEPVLCELRKAGVDLLGPLPADTLFTPKYLDSADAVLSMYHDQGLPVLKFKGFGNASNITLGLPIIRTSVDHGTAIDIAGSGQVETGSIYNAIYTANEMIEHWKMNETRKLSY